MLSTEKITVLDTTDQFEIVRAESDEGWPFYRRFTISFRVRRRDEEGRTVGIEVLMKRNGDVTSRMRHGAGELCSSAEAVLVMSRMLDLAAAEVAGRETPGRGASRMAYLLKQMRKQAA